MAKIRPLALVMPAFVVLVIGVGGTAAAPPAAPEASRPRPPRPADAIAALCFNIRYDEPRDGENRWPHRRGQVLEILRDGGWDFIGVQEALPHQVREIAAALPDHGLVVRSREVDPERGEACPLLYRSDRWRLVDQGTFWISSTPDEPGSSDWESACPRIATWGRFAPRRPMPALGGTLLVVNTHLDHRSARAREEGARLVRALVDRHEGAAIVMGDFNAPPDGRVMQILQGPPHAPLRDAHADFPGGAGHGTYHGFRGAGGAARIDWILFNDRLARLDATIDRSSREGRFPSDHFPVSAILQPRLREPLPEAPLRQPQASPPRTPRPD